MKWSYLLSWIRRLLTRWLPAVILRRAFPVGKCEQQVIVLSEGAGPDIYIRPGRRFSIECLTLKVINQLPFPITIDGFWLQIVANSRPVTRCDRVYRAPILPGGITDLDGSCELADNQADMFRQDSTDWVILHLGGAIQVRTCVVDFQKFIQINTRAAIHRK